MITFEGKDPIRSQSVWSFIVTLFNEYCLEFNILHGNESENQEKRVNLYKFIFILLV